MKNFFKKTISLILALTIIFSLAAPSFAADSSDKTVAKITFFSYSKNPGHCWIYVENTSQEVINVGAYALVPGKGVSVGTFGFTRYDGWGIYYNIEAYAQNTYGFGKFVTLTDTLTSSELQKLTNGILSYNNRWGIFYNCVHFAVKMWNLVADKHLVSLIFPSVETALVTLMGGKSNNVTMNPVAANDVFKQIGTGDSAYLATVSEASLGDII